MFYLEKRVLCAINAQLKQKLFRALTAILNVYF